MAIDKQILQIIVRLTDGMLASADRRRALLDFARMNGWRPSDIEDYPSVADLANAHLVVEHGLDHSIVISFLHSNAPYAHLQRSDKLRLLTLSYNNLVDWHFFPDRDGVQWVFNRTDPPEEGRLYISDDPTSWSAESFEKVVGRRPNPNVKSLDDALITTISEWRRMLALELRDNTKVKHLSLLFNSILFVRALEDTFKAQGQTLPTELLIDLWHGSSAPKTFGNCVATALRQLSITKYPTAVLGLRSSLKVFDDLDRQTVGQLFADFYRNRHCRPYRYDFSVMSKHALSRIYEHYVSLLREKESPQMRLFPDLPEEVRNKALGGIYTPQYIARFFAKYLKESHTPPAFRALRVADPACGSGIFPRTLLELQCDPLQDIDVQSVASSAFKNVLCIDVDHNACQATRLSLALLHLVLTRRVPDKLDVAESETVLYYQQHELSLKEQFDAVMANPPYVKWDRMGSELRRRFERFLGPLATGKIDAYQAHLEVGLRFVRPGGFVLYVLPHAFLMANAAAGLRQRIAREFWIRVIADLSEIPVFDVGSYVILLVLQRKTAVLVEEPAATIVTCKEFVGHALQDALEDRVVSNEFYSTYKVPQKVFHEPEWYILPPKQFMIKEKVARHRRLDEFLEIREGIVTGADDVFIRYRNDIPHEEEAVYRPLLPDRDMGRYVVPPNLNKVVFYPYVGDHKLIPKQLRQDFPQTWKYLQSHKKALSRRGSVSRSGNPWWAPVRPRSPKNILRHKIVSPHLVALPRFALDMRGDVLISHSPFMYPKTAEREEADLRYFVAVLNSRVVFWQMMHMSHKYARGYLMLEKKTLGPILVPAPDSVPASRMAGLQQLVEQRLGGDEQVETEIDRVVCELYGLTADDMMELDY